MKLGLNLHLKTIYLCDRTRMLASTLVLIQALSFVIVFGVGCISPTETGNSGIITKDTGSGSGGEVPPLAPPESLPPSLLASAAINVAIETPALSSSTNASSDCSTSLLS